MVYRGPGTKAGFVSAGNDVLIACDYLLCERLLVSVGNDARLIGLSCENVSWVSGT